MSESWFTILLFCAAALVIAVSGVRMTKFADKLADRTRLGEAVVGGLLLGMSTSLSGVVTSVSAAWNGLASLAASNAVGGIAVQTTFLVLADLTYRQANLEHAAADAKNMLQAALLVVMLSLVLTAYLAPEFRPSFDPSSQRRVGRCVHIRGENHDSARAGTDVASTADREDPPRRTG